MMRICLDLRLARELWLGLQSRFLVESVKGPALALESHNHVHRRDRSSLGTFGVSDSIVKNRREKLLENTTGLGIHETRDALDATLARQPPDRGLGNAFLVRLGFVVPLPRGTALAKTLALETLGIGLGRKMLDAVVEKEVRS